ncbi:MAG: zinc ribbon domain-containing protein [Limnochordia bacterium]
MASAREHIAKLWQLQLVDIAKQACEHALANPTTQAAYDRLMASTRKILTQAKHSESTLTAARQKLRSHELDLASLSQEIKSMEDRLYSSDTKSTKELRSIEQRLQLNKVRCAETEEHALELMEQIEEINAQLDDQCREAESLGRQLRQAKAELDSELNQIREDAQQAAERRADLLRDIDPAWLERYEKMRRQRGPDAIARITDSMCEGCRVRLPFSLIMAASTVSTPTFCENCGRMLYAPS